jgi:hypothetical protein
MMLQTKDENTMTTCTLCGEEVGPPPPPKHTMEELAEAQERRDRWRIVSTAVTGVQLSFLAAGIRFLDRFAGSPWLVLLWVLSVPVGSAVISLLRPDDAFLEEPPRPKSRVLLFLTLLTTMLLIAAAVAAVLFFIVVILNN